MESSPADQYDDETLVTDPEGARLLRVGMTTFLELQKQPGFPAPVWLGPRMKRHRRRALMQWALGKREKPPEASCAAATRREQEVA